MEVSPFSAGPALWGKKGVLKTEILYLAVVGKVRNGDLPNRGEASEYC